MKGNHVKQRYDRTLINLTSFTGSDFFFFFFLLFHQDMTF